MASLGSSKLAHGEDPPPRITDQKVEKQGQEEKVEKGRLKELLQTIRSEELINIANEAYLRQYKQELSSSPNIQSTRKLKIRQQIGLLSIYATQGRNTVASIVKSALKKTYKAQNNRLKHALKTEGQRVEVKKEAKKRNLFVFLQQRAKIMPLWLYEAKPPPLCGAVPAEPKHIARIGDLVAAFHLVNDEENWILTEVKGYDRNTEMYSLIDVDVDKTLLTVHRRQVLPLPRRRANPILNPDCVHRNRAIVMALFPQTTCFYKAKIIKKLAHPSAKYVLIFEDESALGGFTKPLRVPQAYVFDFFEIEKYAVEYNAPASIESYTIKDADVNEETEYSHSNPVIPPSLQTVKPDSNLGDNVSDELMIETECQYMGPYAPYLGPYPYPRIDSEQGEVTIGEDYPTSEQMEYTYWVEGIPDSVHVHYNFPLPVNLPHLEINEEDFWLPALYTIPELDEEDFPLPADASLLELDKEDYPSSADIPLLEINEEDFALPALNPIPELDEEDFPLPADAPLVELNEEDYPSPVDIPLLELDEEDFALLALFPLLELDENNFPLPTEIPVLDLDEDDFALPSKSERNGTNNPSDPTVLFEL